MKTFEKFIKIQENWLFKNDLEKIREIEKILYSAKDSREKLREIGLKHGDKKTVLQEKRNVVDNMLRSMEMDYNFIQKCEKLQDFKTEIVGHMDMFSSLIEYIRDKWKNFDPRIIINLKNATHYFNMCNKGLGIKKMYVIRSLDEKHIRIILKEKPEIIKCKEDEFSEENWAGVPDSSTTSQMSTPTVEKEPETPKQELPIQQKSPQSEEKIDKESEIW